MSKRKITNSQAKAIVELLSDNSHSAHYLRVELTKNIIPHLFDGKTKLSKNHTGWVRAKFDDNFLGYSENGILKYGFDTKGIWVSDTDVELYSYSFEATEEEVKEALTKEAIKRGFVNGSYYKWDNCPLRKVYGNAYVYDGSVFRINGFSIMDKDGVWAQIQETISKEQAEKELGKKIID